MKASEYIKQGWCQGDTAQDRTGRRVSVFSPIATKFCVVGALGRAYSDTHHLTESLFQLEQSHQQDELMKTLRQKFKAVLLNKAVDALDVRVQAQGYASLNRWNDAPQRSQTEVVELLESVGL